MSRKDYVKFAEMVKFAHYLTAEQKEQLAKEMAGIFAGDNGNFNRERFLGACRESDPIQARGCVSSSRD